MNAPQHRPRQFSFRKPVAAHPEGEASELKGSILRKWSQYLQEHDGKNAATIDKLAAEHPVVWKRTVRTPCVLLPFDAGEQRAFSTGHFQVHYRREHGGGKREGAPPRSQPPQQQQPKKSHGSAPFPKRNIDWRINQGKEELHDGRHKQDDDDEILWATDDSGVGIFDADGNFRFISDSIAGDDAQASKAPLNKEALFGGPPANQHAPAIQPPRSPNLPWLYKDPKGNVQGPFSSVQMFDWYSRGFFPESLPLCREGESSFESLAAWKVGSGGRCPFEPAAVSNTAPGFSLPAEQAQPAPSPSAQPIRFGTVVSGEDPIVNVPVRKPAIAATEPPKQPAVDEVEEQRRFLEGLMLSSKQHKEPKQLDQPAKKVQLAQIMADQAQELQTKYTAPLPSPALKPAPLSNPDIAREPVNPWKTVHASTAIQPLSEIQRQQQQQQQSAKDRDPSVVQQRPSGPKSFADLLAASPVSSASPKGSSSIIDSQAIRKASPASPTPPVQPPISKPKTVHQTQTQTQSLPTPQPKPDPLRDWVVSRLASVQVDAGMLFALLADCRASEEAACLLRDNLVNPALPEQKAGMQQFGKEYLKRRFGKQVSNAALEVVCTKPVDDRDERKEADFSTVVRRKK